MRHKYIFDPEAIHADGTKGALVKVPTTWSQPIAGPFVSGDLPGYQSPVTGLWVEGRKARREDLKRTGSRPWEGMDAEKKEAARQQAYQEQKADRRIDEIARRSYYSLDPNKRRILERGG